MRTANPTVEANKPCPCGSGKPFAGCCGRFLGGEMAPTAEALMRSRYTAYVLGDDDYLLRTWHPSTRPASVDSGVGPVWTGLQVLASTGGGPDDTQGAVEFMARYRDGTRLGSLHETSRFVREEGAWLYLDGEIHPAAEAGTKVGRNALCPCGSGRKFKRCCGSGR